MPVNDFFLSLPEPHFLRVSTNVLKNEKTNHLSLSQLLCSPNPALTPRTSQKGDRKLSYDGLLGR